MAKVKFFRVEEELFPGMRINHTATRLLAVRENEDLTQRVNACYAPNHDSRVHTQLVRVINDRGED